jgi:hypothetical protein
MVEELQAEAARRAGSPESVARLIRLVMGEWDRSPFSYTIQELAEGFAEIQLQGESVDEIFIHPEDSHELLRLCSTIDSETEESRVVGYLWGAVIWKDETISRFPHHRINLRSESRSVWI